MEDGQGTSEMNSWNLSDFLPNHTVALIEAEVSKRIGGSLEELLPRVGFSVHRDEILLTGSLIEGFGNVSSDIDIYVIGQNGDLRGCRQFYWTEANRWVDIQYFQAEDIQTLKRRVELNGSCAPDYWGHHATATLDDIDIYHRIVNGYKLNRLLREIADPSSPAYLTLDHKVIQIELAITSIIIARSRWLDAIGAATSGQFLQAQYVALIGFGHAIDAYLSLLGQTNPSSKWRLAKLNRLSENPLNLSLQDCVPTLDFETPRNRAELIIMSLAKLLFHTMHYCIHGEFSDYPQCSWYERWEPYKTRIFRIISTGEALSD